MKKQILTAISTHPIRAAFLLILPFLLGPATHQALAQRNTGERIVAASTSQLPTTSSGPISMSALRIPPMPKAPQVVLYDQYNNAGTNATLSATFTDFPTFSSDLADDFVVPAGQTWNVQSIDADGVYFNGPGPANSWNVFIYADNAGFPGMQVFSATNQPVTVVGTTYTVTLPVPAVLTAGTYWVEIQANMTFSPNGEWGWTDRTVTSNNAAAFQNPGGGLGICPSWSRRGATCNIDPSAPDQVYRLNGTMGGGGTCADYSFTSGTATFVPGVTDTGNHCDDCVTPITLPFPVTLYDQMFTTANVGSNGALFFGTANPSFAITCSPLGLAGTTYTMGPFWDDQVTFNAGEGIFTTTTGTAPNRVFYIEWRAEYYATGQPLNYEIALYENGTPPFRYIYNSIPVKTSSNDSQLVVGVKKDDTTGDFTQYGCDPTGGTNPPVSSGQALTAACAGGGCPTCNNPYTYTVSTGTIVPGTVDTGNHCDDCDTTITLPFAYNLYDQAFNTAHVGSNGHLTFGTEFSSFSIVCPMPEPTATYAVGPYWTDQCTDTPCASGTPGALGIFTSTSGVAPNRIFNIEYRTNYYNTTTTLNYEVRLYEGQQAFDVIYGTVNALGSPNDSALAVGVQQNSTQFTQEGCDSTGGTAPPVSTGQLYHYTIAACPPGPVPTDAVSRKVHGAAGTFDIELPRVDIHGAVGIEDRTQGAGGATCGAWNLAANYPGGTLESAAVSTNGTYAYAAGGFVNLAASNLLYRYDPVANTWTPRANMPAAVYDARAAYAANVNKVYVFGGYDGTAVLNTTYIYDVVSNTWTTGAPMPDVRIWAEAAYYSGNGKIYVIGGLDSGFTEQSQTWEYDPVANTWNTSRTAAPVGEGSSNTAVSGQFIYLMGGYGGGVGSTNHYRYDIVGDTWTAMAPLPVPDRMAGSGDIGGQNYLFGGGTPSVGAGVKDPKVKNPKAANPKAALHASHAFPGANPKVAPYASPEAPDAYTSTYIYDIASNTWSTGPNMNAPHSWTNGAAIGNTLVVVAGFNGTTGDTNTVETTACVTGGAFNHQMVVTFAVPVTVQSVSVTTGTGSVSSFTVSSNVVTVNLTGVTNAQRLGVTLHNVCDGTNQGDVLIPMGVLSGDVNGNGTVSAADVALTKAQVGHAVGGSNFREDVNANGVLNAIDVAIVKSKTGTALPP